MWEVENQTPYADHHSWVRDRQGAEVWLVAVRGTFHIRPDGSTDLAAEQDPVCVLPRHRDDTPRSSLLYDTDIHHTKPTTDILLHGHAYAPAGASTVDTRLFIPGVLDKTLRVFGHRRWTRGIGGPALSRPDRFDRMPLVYERAYGGMSGETGSETWDERNPLGVGFATAADELIDRPAANVEDPTALISSWRDRPRPAGYGPVPCHWAPRRRWAGTYDDTWSRERQPLLPDDFDERFYLGAPEDQQAREYLRGGERVELTNLTASGRLCFSLPLVALRFETFFATGERIAHRAEVHTVIVEPDIPRVILVWHTSLRCHGKVLDLESTRITEKTVLARSSSRRSQ